MNSMGGVKPAWSNSQLIGLQYIAVMIFLNTYMVPLHV
jgi:hypothetical protein